MIGQDPQLLRDDQPVAKVENDKVEQNNEDDILMYSSQVKST